MYPDGVSCSDILSTHVKLHFVRLVLRPEQELKSSLMACSVLLVAASKTFETSSILDIYPDLFNQL